MSSSLSRAGLVRSEYEQEQMLKELLANEAQAARIAKGGCAVPSMLTARRDEDARTCLLYTSPSPRDKRQSRMPSSA